MKLPVCSAPVFAGRALRSLLNAGILTLPFWSAFSLAASDVPLENYDASVLEDVQRGLEPVVSLTTAVTLDGTTGVPFDFGTATGDATIEFILEADPLFTNSSFLAVGSDSDSSLRYEVWDDTGELGFTLAGVADYQFSPGVPSPTRPTHVAYAWDPANQTMSLYLNGKLVGTTTGIDASFKIPAGAGFLGGNPSHEELMKGVIHRVTVYDTLLDAATVRRHSDAFGGDVLPALAGYDAAISADDTAGVHPAGALTATVVLPKTGATTFDFGDVSEDVTMEFILKGDPGLNNSAFLAVAGNGNSSLRYEVWPDTGEIGFTQAGSADYQFAPGVASPVQPTHVTYAWNAGSHVMKLYVNGVLAGTTTSVDPNFSMPHGIGRLGVNPAGNERMSGIIYRVTVYDDLLDDAAILRHAKGFTDVLQPPVITGFTATAGHIDARTPVTLNWLVEHAKTVSLNGIDVTGQSSITVSPEVTTRYTLTASSEIATIEAKLTLYVVPPLSGYDAAIDADVAAGLAPSARLSTALDLTGSAGSAFDFGPASPDSTFEVILEGDASANVDAFIAVGEVHTSSLRYEAWYDTQQLGFTLNRVADYLFNPPAVSPAWPTHLAYVYDSTGTTMSLYINGHLAGTTTGVGESFVMPSGLGMLGANEEGGEGLVGTIHRVTIYPSLLTPEVIERHAAAFLGKASPGLRAYDASVDAGAAPAARLLQPLVFTGGAGAPFDFGVTTEDATVELLLEGNPDANGSAFIGVGSNKDSSLRYEVWDNTGELGFTLAGVADYQFSPGIPSPRTLTHVAYVWQPATTTMTLYINGVASGTTKNVDDGFSIPTGLGTLGSAGDGSEGMVGTIHRVTVYDSALPAGDIAGHATAYLNAIKAPSLAIAIGKTAVQISLAQGIEGAHYRIETRGSLDAADVWKVLSDIPSLTGTTAVVQDTTLPAAGSHRYYRAVRVN